jgi:hypothetical protein
LFTMGSVVVWCSPNDVCDVFLYPDFASLDELMRVPMSHTQPPPVCNV